MVKQYVSSRVASRGYQLWSGPIESNKYMHRGDYTPSGKIWSSTGNAGGVESQQSTLSNPDTVQSSDVPQVNSSVPAGSQPGLTEPSLQQVCSFDTEDEDVESWIQTIERVAHIHGVTNDILLLAATVKLKNTARKWFDLNIMLLHVAMQKVEACKWNFVKETFQDYAMEKLVLMKNLKLPERDTIHLLINEIDSRLLRELAVALRVHSVDGFLEEMQRITASSGESFKKPQSSFTKSQNIKVPSKDSSATDTNH
ncbi:hypothetical protein RF55_12864 [Lasius niger]|uniref:Uncharacterized protein n=1 Tax=Lasius niger TaxID=67767 RepID=A0A0J7KBZ6_LASNI|nr:hypothetical protein RF55_12864 [Lasius niger]